MWVPIWEVYTDWVQEEFYHGNANAKLIQIVHRWDYQVPLVPEGHVAEVAERFNMAASVKLLSLYKEPARHKAEQGIQS